MFYHALGFLREDALGGFTGSVRIKSDGFDEDTLHILGRDVCLQRASPCNHPVFYHALGLLRGDALGGFTGSVRIKQKCWFC